MPDERVLGVDACNAGWVGIALDRDRTSAYFEPAIDELVARAESDGPVAVVAIDMPIGLPDNGRRQADLLAQKAIGKLRSSVFITPVRAALEAPDHRTATARNHALAGAGISIQAFGLKPKLQQVERWVRQTHHRVVEAHPEVSFAQLAGSPLPVRKKTWAGTELRRRLLVEAGILLGGDLGAAGARAAVDDVLDAAACAWTARRVARGEAQARPDPPEIFSDGLQCAIWS
ncbi:MAG: DUF429 domain-containing protein [Pseudonocardiaceae bacterium]